jgi:hypothetical protein
MPVRFNKFSSLVRTAWRPRMRRTCDIIRSECASLAGRHSTRCARTKRGAAQANFPARALHMSSVRLPSISQRATVTTLRHRFSALRTRSGSRFDHGHCTPLLFRAPSSMHVSDSRASIPQSWGNCSSTLVSSSRKIARRRVPLAMGTSVVAKRQSCINYDPRVRSSHCSVRNVEHCNIELYAGVSKRIESRFSSLAAGSSRDNTRPEKLSSNTKPHSEMGMSTACPRRNRTATSGCAQRRSFGTGTQVLWIFRRDLFSLSFNEHSIKPTGTPLTIIIHQT